MSDLELEENLEKSLSGFTRSILDTACSEMEMEISDLHAIELPNQEETASEEEREEYFKKIRQEEYIQLIENAEREREMSEQVLHTKDGKAGNTNDVGIAVEREQAEEQGEHPTHHLAEKSKGERFAQTTTDEETAGEEERIAFFQAVRDAEYNKLLEAVKRDSKSKEQKEQGTEIALTDKQCDDFFNVAVDETVYTSTRELSQQNDYYQQPSVSADETYSCFNNTSPKSTPSVSDTSAHAPEIIQYNDETAHAPEIIQYNYETGSTKNVFTPTENKRPFERSVSDVGVKRQKSKNRLILNFFKQSKSLSNFQKDLPTQTCEKKTDVKEVAVKTLELPVWDADDFVEPPKPTLKPFFSNTEAAELIKPVVVDTEEETSRGNILTRATRRFREWLRSLSCCCCKSDIVDNRR